MSKRQVNHHSGVVIVEDESKSRFMVQVYDDTYPRTYWQGAAHLIGGNYQKPEHGKRGDNSPREIYTREVIEEFALGGEDPTKGIESSVANIVGTGPGAKRQTNFAPEADIFNLRDAVLRGTPYGDFIYTIPELNGKQGFTSLVSIYHAFLPTNEFDIAEVHLANGRAIRNEGITAIISADDLITGKILPAWFTSRIMAEHLGKELPNPQGIIAERLGMPVEDWSHYLDRFDYKQPPVVVSD